MRRSLVLVAALAIATALPGTASAGVVPTVAFGSCTLDANNGTAVCIVQLDANPNGEFGQSTNDIDGYGSADLVCNLSGSRRIAGGYGFEWHPFPHGADVCRLTLQMSGAGFAYVT